jgi:curved DNA-binding protein CbpA
MLEINEAYEVLSNPARRQSFDLEYERQARRQQPPGGGAQTQTVTRPTPPNADPRWGNVGPTFPVPAAFGIDADYLARAQEGAAEWQRREHRIPQRVKWLTRGLSGIAGLSTSLLFLRHQKGRPTVLLAWLVLPMLAELILWLIEKIRDRHLLRYKFNPLYNPNPAGFQAYAAARATYEADTMRVYVARNAIYHEHKTCPQLASYEPMPKWFARFRKAQPCAHCCRSVKAVPKKLPPPFGKGTLQKNQ